MIPGPLIIIGLGTLMMLAIGTPIGELPAALDAAPEPPAALAAAAEPDPAAPDAADPAPEPDAAAPAAPPNPDLEPPAALDAAPEPPAAPDAADPPEPEAAPDAAPPEPPDAAPAAADPLPSAPSVVVELEDAAPPSPTVVVVDAEPLGNELVSRSLVAAPNREKGFVIALSNQAPDEAPPDAIRFSAVPAMLAIGLDTVSSIPALIPSANTLFAFDKLVAMFWKATPAVVTGRPTVSLYNFAKPSVPVSILSVPAVNSFLEPCATASVIPSTTFPFRRCVDVAAEAAPPPAPAPAADAAPDPEPPLPLPALEAAEPDA